MSSHPIRQRHPLSGFTLVELLVACVLTMILAVVLLGVFSNVAGTYQQIEGRTDSFREARAALQFAAGELSQIVDVQSLANTNSPGYSPAPPKVELDIDPDSLGGSLGFLTRLPSAVQPPNTGPSDVCLVAYFLSKPTSGEGQSLYRRLIPSKDAFARLAGGSSFFQAGDFDPAGSEALAANVLDFRVSLKDEELQPVASTNSAAYVELELEVIGSRAAKLYFAPGTPDAVRERLKEKEVRDFTLRWRL
ncbi:MAG: hypothetical protein E6Q40_14750 [Cupriavidus sp.]|jgi:type II secretory pathway pseudopilin PulG|nr:MAG: hypothetical protein E6Q40_14750 [Cupriavidus sp.]